jgi:hypothetical protein
MCTQASAHESIVTPPPLVLPLPLPPPSDPTLTTWPAQAAKANAKNKGVATRRVGFILLTLLMAGTGRLGARVVSQEYVTIETVHDTSEG